MSLRKNRPSLLTRDFLPGVTPFTRWVRTPLGSLAFSAIASGLCGLFLHPQGFLVFFGVVVVTTLGLVWPWISVRGLKGVLIFEQSRCREGEPITAKLIVRNRCPWGAWGVSLKADVGAGVDGNLETIVAGLVFVPGWRTSEVTFEWVSHCRGLYPRRSLLLVTGFPFGLWEASRNVMAPEPLLVWPRTFAVAPLPEAADGHASEGLATHDRPGNWGDLLGVRPYRRGDSLRRVHWAQTARHGEMIVCEVQSNASPRIQVILNTDSTAQVGSGSDSSREWGIRIAASLLEGWGGQGAEVELLFGDRVICRHAGTCRSTASSRLDTIACWESQQDQEHVSVVEPLREFRSPAGRIRVVITTDLGLRAFAEGSRWQSEIRFIVLRARGFGHDADGDFLEGLPVAPWVVIEGPAHVASSLRKLGKEVVVGC